LSKQAVQNLKTYLKSRGKSTGPEVPVFPSQKYPRRPMNSTWAVQLLAKMFREGGVANASSHSLRRTHANTLRRNGADLLIIQMQLGHSSLATTQRYFQADPIEVQNAVDGLRF
jgi:integrase